MPANEPEIDPAATIVPIESPIESPQPFAEPAPAMDSDPGAEAAALDHPTEVFDWSECGFPPGSPEPVAGWLVVVRGSGRGRFLALGYGIHELGRGEDQRIRLNFGDRSISRQGHLKITYDGEGRNFYVSPGQSMKIAYLNGKPVLHMFSLKTGDVIRLGDTELAFVSFCGENFDWKQRS
jgi:hypothetical protein